MATVVAEKVIRIDVVASAGAQRAINAIAADMKKIESSASAMKKSTEQGFAGLNSVLGKTAGFLGAFGIATGFGAVSKAILDAASSYQVLESRLKLVLGTQEAANRATESIIDIAKASGREIDGVAKLYEKTARAAQQFGIAEQQITDITTGFAQSLRLSGAGTQEAYAAMVQFGQALASGRLQGDEFRSLMENNAVFMYEFAKAAGVTVSELRKMGTEGKLNAKFLFDTMAKEGSDGLTVMQRLKKMAEEVPLTFKESLESMGSSLTEFTGVMAKFFTLKSDDKYGIFGPLIRGVDEMTARLKDLNTEAAALGSGFFGRLIALMKSESGFGGGKNAPNSPLTAILKSLGLMDESGKTLGQKLDDIYADALKRVEENQARLKAAEAGGLRGALRNPALERKADEQRAATIARAQAALAASEDMLRKASTARANFNYGPTGDFKDRPPIEDTLGAAEEKRRKTALETLKDFVELKEREAEASRQLLAGEAETKKSATDALKLEALRKEAVQGTNAELVKRGQLAIAADEKNKLGLAKQKELEKFQEQEKEATRSIEEGLKRQIERDDAAIEALLKRTKATDEYTESALERGRAETALAASAEAAALGYDSATVQNLYALMELYDKAIVKKAELMNARADKQAQDEQNRIDERNEKRITSLSEEISQMLTKGILDEGGKSPAEQFVDNLQRALRDKAVEIVVKPVTDIISRELARIADEFSKMLTRSLYESIANASDDPIGMLGNLLTGKSSLFSSTSSNSSSYIPMQPGGGYEKGLSYVPFDNFPATLHQGERVLTANENKEYSGGKGAITLNSSPVYNIDSRSDAAHVAQIAAEITAAGNRQLVAELRAQGAL